MNPFWVLVLLTWYHFSRGAETEDYRSKSKGKNTVILQSSDLSQRQIDYDVVPIENYSLTPPKYGHFFAPNDDSDDEVMIYSIAFSGGSTDDYPNAIANKQKRSTDAENKMPSRSNIYNLLLQAQNLERAETGLAGKRNSKFYSWGGKRPSIDYISPPPSTYVDVDPSVFYENMKKTYDINENNRVRFSSWGGKRQEEERAGAPKTVPFRSWGGKRDKPDILVWPKYTPFKAWGGKRGESIGFYPPEEQSLNSPLKKNNRVRRPRFHSWGGKRNDASVPAANTTPQQEGNGEIPLSLRRGEEGEEPGLLYRSGDVWKGDGRSNKRSKFSAWGGKRSPEGADLKRFPAGDYPLYKKTFHSWGGKRIASTSTEPEMTDNDEISLVSFDI